jgi:mRNA interferase MazF
MEITKELIKIFADWTKLKIRIHASEKEIYFKDRQVWWTNLGKNIGVEADGKNINFERPVIILKRFNKHSFLGIPLSSRVKIGGYYLQLKDIKGRSSVVNLSQIRIMSSKRLIREIEEISESDSKLIKETIKNYL